MLWHALQVVLGLSQVRTTALGQAELSWEPCPGGWASFPVSGPQKAPQLQPTWLEGRRRQAGVSAQLGRGRVGDKVPLGLDFRDRQNLPRGTKRRERCGGRMAKRS